MPQTDTEQIRAVIATLPEKDRAVILKALVDQLAALKAQQQGRERHR